MVNVPTRFCPLRPRVHGQRDSSLANSACTHRAAVAAGRARSGWQSVVAVPALLVGGALGLLLAGCGRSQPEASSSPPAARAAAVLGRFSGTAIGATTDARPLITHVSLADLDGDGRLDVLACDAKQNAVVWLRQEPAGVFTETVVAAEIPGPVHVEAVDFDGDSDRDLLVASMGQVFPNNDRIGSVIVLENEGANRFARHVVLERVARVTDVRAGDFNGDGRLDLAVGQFGYLQGEICWLENRGDWKFARHGLLDLPGTVNVGVADMNGDRTLDIVALVSQQTEEIQLFANDGKGNFAKRVIFGSTNEDFGSSGISLADLNRDGRPDVLYTNGDGFDYAEPGSRPWHGVQWLENLGEGRFRSHRLGDLPGAYSPVAGDFDGDGAVDVVAVSAFADWKKPDAVSLMLFRNDGRLNFSAHVLAHAPTHLITCAAGDLGGDGKVAIVTGGFHAFPPWDRTSRIMVWKREP